MLRRKLSRRARRCVVDPNKPNGTRRARDQPVYNRGCRRGVYPHNHTGGLAYLLGGVMAWQPIPAVVSTLRRANAPSPPEVLDRSHPAPLHSDQASLDGPSHHGTARRVGRSGRSPVRIRRDANEGLAGVDTETGHPSQSGRSFVENSDNTSGGSLWQPYEPVHVIWRSQKSPLPLSSTSPRPWSVLIAVRTWVARARPSISPYMSSTASTGRSGLSLREHIPQVARKINTSFCV